MGILRDPQKTKLYEIESVSELKLLYFQYIEVSSNELTMAQSTNSKCVILKRLISYLLPVVTGV
jgi:hypothetical protein